MDELGTYRVTAHNTATASTNKIHDDAVARARTGDGETIDLELRNSDGERCASGRARLDRAPPPPPEVDAWPAVEPAVSPPPATPEALPPGTALALAPHTFHADRAVEYLADIREHLPLYTEHAVAHPGWLLRDANHVLSSNVVLGPWIHVESAAQHHGLVKDGEMVEARAVVRREWERKGHRFVELDVLLLAERHRPVARVTHTAIYRPRPPMG